MQEIEQNEAQEVQEETPTKATGIVIWTDGSARPNPGFIGWGVHGYLYEQTEKKPTVVSNHYVTDKGYISIHNKKHQAVKYVLPIKYFDFVGSSLTIGSNNQAEIQAFCHALERLEEFNASEILIYTDSELTKNGVNNWCANWEKAGWKKADGNTVANHEWWLRLYSKIKEMRAKGVKIHVEWVRAHNGDHGNTIADALSVIGMNYSTDHKACGSYSITDARVYQTPEIEKHPFINFKRIYFNSVAQFNMPGHYFQADPGGSDFIIGKRIPETGFSVVRLTEADHVIETVKSKQYEVANDINAIIMIKLDNVFNKNIYPLLSEHGRQSMLGNQRNLNLEYVDRTPITVEINPTGLSLRAIEGFNLLEDLLNRFQEYKETGFTQADNNISLHSHDITDVFFDKEEKTVKKETVVKLVLKPKFNVGFRDLVVEVEEPFEDKMKTIKVPLILGSDILPRNNLKKLEDHNPIVHLITWRDSLNSLRYATVIECDTGIGIWSNFFADKIFFT